MSKIAELEKEIEGGFEVSYPRIFGEAVGLGDVPDMDIKKIWKNEPVEEYKFESFEVFGRSYDVVFEELKLRILEYLKDKAERRLLWRIRPEVRKVIDFDLDAPTYLGLARVILLP